MYLTGDLVDLNGELVEGMKYIVSNDTFFEFEYLQSLAKKQNIKKAIKDNKDEYFLCGLYNEDPAYSCTAVNGGLYDSNVLRCTSKFFVNPKYANKMPVSLFKTICLFGTEFFIKHKKKEFDKFNFYFISRHPNSSPIKRLYQKIGWTIDDPYLYLIGKYPEKESSWRHIYYIGDINNFKVPRMTMEEYKEKFGDYRFNKNWSDNAIENTKYLIKDISVNKVLEIGTFEGRYALWFADNHDIKIHTIDPFKADIYKLSQSLFDEVEENWLSNLSNCKNKDKIVFYKDYSSNVLLKLINENKKFDFIYIDGYHKASIVMEDLVLSFKLLNQNGIILIDDAVDWQARDYNTNEIINDITLTPKLAVDSFIEIYKNEIIVLDIPRKNQVAIKKL